jgi:hypothetical protein
MELHMDSDVGYDLDYTDEDGSEVDAELTAMLDDKRLKHDGGRLLRVLSDIARRGANAKKDNIHSDSTDPVLHSVRVGKCAAFYAYGQRNGAITVFLLGFYEKELFSRSVGTAGSRLANVP